MIAVCSVIWKYIINMQLNCRNDWDLGDVLNVVYKDICRLSMKSEHSLYTLFTCCSPPGQQSCAATWILPFNLPALPLPSAVHVVTSIFLLRPKKPTFFFLKATGNLSLQVILNCSERLHMFLYSNSLSFKQQGVKIS